MGEGELLVAQFADDDLGDGVGGLLDASVRGSEGLVEGLVAVVEQELDEVAFHLGRCDECRVKASGFINLDFMGNLGHSIVRKKDDRIYIEKGNAAKLGDVEFFTFEPHISRPDSVFGYKKENIYYFENGALTEL